MKALLLIDFQNDFGGFGPLAHPQASAILKNIIPYLESKAFTLRVASQNWIPANHPIFAANHYFRYPKQLISLYGNQERLWPIYGVKESFGADWMPAFPIQKVDKIIQKGLTDKVLPYSCFAAANSFNLHEYLQEHGIKELVLAGFLTEFAVAYTAMDALDLGYQVTVIKKLCAAANLDSMNDEDLALSALEKAGVEVK